MVLLHFIRVHGRKNIPKKGPLILASNHVSLGDPPIVGVTCNRVPIHFLAKEELFYGKRWGWWFRWTRCIPISRDKNNFKAIKEILAKLKEGRAIGLFPEGTRSETGELQEAELGVGFLAVKSKAPVIPMYISGSKKALPVGGPYRPGLPIKVYIGKPVDLSEAEKISDRRQKYRFASDKIMQAIASLKRPAK